MKEDRRLFGLVKYWWVFVLSMLIFIFFVLMKPSWINSGYFLSSISQGFASLVALLFVIIFFLCRTSGRISILGKILEPDGYFLLVVFILTILYPLFMLRLEVSSFLVNLSVFFASFSIISLFPFIKFIKNKLFESGIRDIIISLNEIELPKQNFRLGELIDDLNKIGSENICKLNSDIIIESLIEILSENLNNSLETKELNISALRSLVHLMVSISRFYGKSDCNSILFKMVHNKIGYTMQYFIVEQNRKIIEFYKWLAYQVENVLRSYNWSKECLSFLKSHYIKIFLRALCRMYMIIIVKSKSNKRLINNQQIIVDLFRNLINKDIIKKEDIDKCFESKNYYPPEGGSKIKLNDNTLDEFERHFNKLLKGNKK